MNSHSLSLTAFLGFATIARFVSANEHFLPPPASTSPVPQAHYSTVPVADPLFNSPGLPGGNGQILGGPYYSYQSGEGSISGNPYVDHFGPGFHRHSLQGHYRFPYYNYRAPWYYPGRAVYNRDTNYAW